MKVVPTNSEKGSTSINDKCNTKQQTPHQASNKGKTDRQESNKRKTDSQASNKEALGRLSANKNGRGVQGVIKGIFWDNSLVTTHKNDKEVKSSVETIEKQDNQGDEGQQEVDEDIDNNIQQASKDEDLSPRQINNLKSGVKKVKCGIPLQVQTRRNEEKINSLQ